MSWNTILCWIEAHPGLSSWIQAIGSIAAIVVAIVLSGRESRYRLKMEKAARANDLQRSISVVQRAKMKLEETMDEMDRGLLTRAAIQIMIGSVNEALAPVRALESSVADHDIGSLLGDARHAVERAGQRIRVAAEDHDNELFYRVPLNQSIAELSSALELLEGMRFKPSALAKLRGWLSSK
ncbi:hypothetical protein D3C76_343200 [compost metagenome]